MLNLTLVHRFRYHPSGKFIVKRFMPGSFLLFLASGVAGFVLMLLYCIVGSAPALIAIATLVPIIVGLTIGWLVAKLVYFSHCRNPLAASSVGAICGAVTFLSACHVAGILAACKSGEPLSDAALRVDRILQVVVHRVYASSLSNMQGKTSSIIHIPRTVILIIEVGLLVWIPLWQGRTTAGRAYDEGSGKWLKISIVRAISGSGNRIVSALKAGQDLTSTLNSIELCSSDPRSAEPKLIQFTIRKKGEIAATQMIFEYQGDQIGDDCQLAYLTVAEISPRGTQVLLIKQLQVQLDEAIAAKKRFVG